MVPGCGCPGVPGRRAAAELTAFKSLGIGIEDLAAAAVAVDRARELGIGTWIEP